VNAAARRKVWRDINGEFVVAAAKVLDEGTSDGDHGG
jgi:hypothetical protein